MLEVLPVAYEIEPGEKEVEEISVSYCVELGEEEEKNKSIYFIVELGEKELEVNLVSYWFVLEGLPVAYKIELGGKVEEGKFSDELGLWGT